MVARPRATLAVTLALLALSVAFATARLTVSTNQNELFSSKVKFFRDFITFNEKFPENDALYIIVQAKGDETRVPVSRWAEAAEAIAARLRALPEHVRSVDARVPIDQLGEQKLLFEDPRELPDTFVGVQHLIGLLRYLGEPAPPVDGQTPARLERFLSYLHVSMAGGNLLARFGWHVGQDQLPVLMRAIAESWTRTLAGEKPVLPDLESLDSPDPSRLGYYYVPDESDRARHLLLVRVYEREAFDSLAAAAKSVDSIRAAVESVAPHFPEFSIGATGRPALDADEMRTTDEDSHKAEIIALVAVFVGLVVLLRSLWLALAAELALGVGIGWTFGWATISVGRLNLLSIVFLLALIGIGMDYLLQILSRYRQEAGRRQHARLIWIAVFRQVGAPINTACMGAAGAFFVAIFGRFRGAAELGIIAGGGLLLCLLAGYTFLPALLTLFPGKLSATAAPPRVRSERPRRKGGRGWRWLIFPALWCLLLLVGVKFAKRTAFNPGLIELQARGLPSVQLVRKLQTWSAVVLSKDLETLRAARDAVRSSPTIDYTDSVLSVMDNEKWLREHYHELPLEHWTPPPELRSEDLAKVIELSRALADRFDAAGAGGRAASTKPVGDAKASAEALRGFADAASAAEPAVAAQKLSAWQKAFLRQIQELAAPFNPKPFDLAKVPNELRSHLVSPQGDYALYLYPKEDLWKQANLAQFVTDVEARLAKVAGQPTVTGIAPNVYHSTQVIRRSFVMSTAMALALIVLLVWIDMRRLRNTVLAISVLAFGLPMLVALMGLLHVDWNFANFFGLPILIGAGHEYGVFMVHRYREVVRDPRRVWGGWDVADKALLACAYVTSSSFGFFWFLGRHQGLRSLGWVMAVGTICIYLSTVLVVRPLLMWRLERRGPRRSDKQI